MHPQSLGDILYPQISQIPQILLTPLFPKNLRNLRNLWRIPEPFPLRSPVVSERSRLAVTESDAAQQRPPADGLAEEALVGSHVAGGCPQAVGQGSLGAGCSRCPSVPRTERRSSARDARESGSAALGASGVMEVNAQRVCGLHAASSPFLLDTRPRPAVPTRSGGQRHRNLAMEAPASVARPPAGRSRGVPARRPEKQIPIACCRSGPFDHDTTLPTPLFPGLDPSPGRRLPEERRGAPVRRRSCPPAEHGLLPPGQRAGHGPGNAGRIATTASHSSKALREECGHQLNRWRERNTG